MLFYNSLSKIFRLIRPTIVKGENNRVSIRSKRHAFYVRVYGDNNTIDIGEGSRLKNTQITMMGSNNHVIAEDGSKFDGPVHITLEGNSTLYIGRNSGLRGVKFIVKDGTITVGRNCMFSYDILLRNTDGHKILDNEGYVTNQPQDITIEDHVWICERCTILKGVTIRTNSVVAFGSVVTKDCPPHSIMAGNPARVVKCNINWLNK